MTYTVSDGTTACNHRERDDFVVLPRSCFKKEKGGEKGEKKKEVGDQIIV